MAARSRPPLTRYRSPRSTATTPATARIATVLIRIPVMVITGELRDPMAMATRHTPKSTVAPTASTTGLAPASPDSSGPLASTTPSSAASKPRYCTTVGVSPSARPSTMGPSPASAVMGDTTPTAPVAMAR